MNGVFLNTFLLQSPEMLILDVVVSSVFILHYSGFIWEALDTYLCMRVIQTFPSILNKLAFNLMLSEKPTKSPKNNLSPCIYNDVFL